jgi:hypothetical protein
MCIKELLYFRPNTVNVWPILTEQGNILLNEHGMFKREKNVDRYGLMHGPRPLLNNRHLAEPPFFSLNTTFNCFYGKPFYVTAYSFWF